MQEFDDDELEAELDALGEELELEEQKELDEQLLDVGPSVPSALPEVLYSATLIDLTEFCFFCDVQKKLVYFKRCFLLFRYIELKTVIGFLYLSLSL